MQNSPADKKRLFKFCVQEADSIIGNEVFSLIKVEGQEDVHNSVLGFVALSPVYFETNS